MMVAVEASRVEATDEQEDMFERKLSEMRQYAKDCVVIVNNIPRIDQDKIPKLMSRVLPKLAGAGEIRKDADDKPCVKFPTDENGRTVGCAFCEFVNPKQAHIAVIKIDGFVLDRNHTFWARTASVFEELQSVPDTFVPPERLPVSRDRPNYKSWLLDERGRDMFAMRHNEITSVFWNDHIVKPKLDCEKTRWSESHVQWSPMGMYMATIHPRGVKLWARRPTENEDEKAQWDVIRKFEHPEVMRIDFSPCENYLVTFNGTPPERDDKKYPRSILVWDIRTGKMKRGFLGPPQSQVGPDGQIPWPVFQWSHQDKYFARRNDGSLSIYQTPDMGLLDKKSVKIPLIQDFSWSPTDNMLAYWLPEAENSPARVSVIEVPSRKELRQKALYSVSDIRLHWHQQGMFLCCKVDRLTKSKKGQFTNFELFRVKAKDIPVEVLEYKETDNVNYFAWEPHGFRFAVIHGYRDDPSRQDVSFYSMEGTSGALKLLRTLEKKTCNQLYWSPKGRFILFATIATQNGALEWYDANDMVPKAEVDPIGTNEHFLCNEVHWDPSGRFVVTLVTYWRNRSDNGYIIWSMYGKELARGNVDILYQFLWRPRPSSLLSSKQEKDVKRNVRTRKLRYEREDKELRDTVSSGRAAQRRKIREEYAEFRGRAEKRMAEEMEKRRAARGNVASDEEDVETIEETIETVISVTSEINYEVKLLTSEDERD